MPAIDCARLIDSRRESGSARERVFMPNEASEHTSTEDAMTQAPVASTVEPTQPIPPTATDGKSGASWGKIGAIVTGIATVIGAIVGIFQIVPSLTKDTTNFSHLAISAEQPATEFTEWALSADAARAGVPVEHGCDGQTESWLAQNGQPLARNLLISVHNSASEGPKLAVSNIRSTTTGDAQRGAVSVRVVCSTNSSAPATMYFAKLVADDPAQEAVHVRLQRDAGAVGTTELPVTVNVGPGEADKVALELFSRNPVAGSVEVTVTSRGEERTVAVEGTEFAMPALLFGGEMFLYISDAGVECYRVEGGALMQCSLDDIDRELSQIGQ